MILIQLEQLERTVKICLSKYFYFDWNIPTRLLTCTVQTLFKKTKTKQNSNFEIFSSHHHICILFWKLTRFSHVSSGDFLSSSKQISASRGGVHRFSLRCEPGINHAFKKLASWEGVNFNSPNIENVHFPLACFFSKAVIRAKLKAARTSVAGSRLAGIVSASGLLCAWAVSNPLQAGREVTQRHAR